MRRLLLWVGAAVLVSILAATTLVAGTIVVLTGACGSAATTTLSGSDNEQKIYNFWLDKGQSSVVAAGITSSMQHEGGFSPFRQEEAESWPNGGYGIAQFTGGQRTAVTAALAKQLGDTFTQYYSPAYGGSASKANGYIPSGITPDVNDKFLSGELNYLSTYISSFVPSSIPTRVNDLLADYGLSVPSGQTLMDYLKSLPSASAAAEAWTYLYEFPGDISAAAATRATSAEAIAKQYSGSSNVTTALDVGCGNKGITNCPSGNSDIQTTSTIAELPVEVVSTANCLTYATRQQGIAACTDGGCFNGPASPPAYEAARKQVKTAGLSGTNPAFDNYGADCGNFVATVMRLSGADPAYPISDVGVQISYMSTSDKYEIVGTTLGSDQLQPGDIVTAFDHSHTLIYIGNGQIAQASQGEEMPLREAMWNMDGTIWRLK